MIQKRLEKLRKKMEEAEIDLYYIPTNDYHGSEYLHDYFKIREYISGFDGSAGTVLVTRNEAGLWTDGRYFLQAEEQLKGSGITLYRSKEEGVLTIKEYIKKKMKKGQTFAAAGRFVSAGWAEEMKTFLGKMEIKIDLSKDLIDEIWENRPKLSFQPAWLLKDQYTGQSRSEKIKKLRNDIEKKDAKSMVLTSLDDIAWLLNIRGEDIPCNPVVFSYLYVNQENCYLFVGENVFSENAQNILKSDGITLKKYEEFLEFVKNLSPDDKVIVDKRTIDAVTMECFPETIEIKDSYCPVLLWKAVKNEIECENMREAHRKDGVAVTKFICWLKKNIGKQKMTEISVAEKLEDFRKEEKNYLGPSFDTIAGYAEHGAIVHYSATEKTNLELKAENFLLVDSGGQYLEGTTDITRTIFLGKEATTEQKKYYTAVLRGNLRLCAAKFKYGCSGVALDYLARSPLWEMGCDYNHGTGHGVGYLLNVHESPNAFRYRILEQPEENAVLEEGMITSDEPGFYLPGKFGIRLENLILCVKKEKNAYGQFMGFEPLTFVPFDRDAIDREQMTEEERELLNSYHEQVYKKLEKSLSQEEREWLWEACRAI